MPSIQEKSPDTSRTRASSSLTMYMKQSSLLERDCSKILFNLADTSWQALIVFLAGFLHTADILPHERWVDASTAGNIRRIEIWKVIEEWLNIVLVDKIYFRQIILKLPSLLAAIKQILLCLLYGTSHRVEMPLVYRIFCMMTVSANRYHCSAWIGTIIAHQSVPS